MAPGGPRLGARCEDLAPILDFLGRNYQADGRTSPCCVLAGEGESVATGSVRDVWESSPSLNAIRAGMLAGRPTGRCAECSENILGHERAIRARLPA